MPKRLKNGRFAKKSGKRKPKRKNRAKRAAAKKKKRLSNGRFAKGGGGRKKKGGSRKKGRRSSSSSHGRHNPFAGFAFLSGIHPNFRPRRGHTKKQRRKAAKAWDRAHGGAHRRKGSKRKRLKNGRFAKKR